jgi:MscS family membrane protein
MALPPHTGLPEALLQRGPFDLFWWQWIALPALILLATALGSVLGSVTAVLLRRIAGLRPGRWDLIAVGRIRGPLTVAWTLAGIYLTVPWLELRQTAQGAVNRMLRVAFLLVVFWALARSVEIVGRWVAQSSWALSRGGARSLVSLAARCGKFGVWTMAVVAVLSELGYPVASLIAGLGIGGLAVALAAQKTVENLFGAFSLGADQPLREGDFVRVEDFVATVETIGLRSTRFRTLDRTLITIPNGRLAEMRLESFTVRDRMRLACTVGVVYGTTAEQLRRVLGGLERTLREHPRIWPDAVVVRFKELAASSLDIEVMAWFQTPEWSEFQLIRQEILLQFMEVVEKAGTSFAFPTRTVHLMGGKG